MFNTQIMKGSNLNLSGNLDKRVAIRGVIINKGKILLVYSRVNGDYKFPGGGVEVAESFADTLIREVLEESGYHVTNIGKQIGTVHEYDLPMTAGYDAFYMISHYFECCVDCSVEYQQHLDTYEAELGFTPVWIDIHSAILANNMVLERGKDIPPWTERETKILELISHNMND